MLELTDRTVTGVFESSVRRHGGRPFLHFEDVETDYDGAARTVARVAAMLHDNGVGAGDRVVLLLDNTPDFVWAVLAVARLGAVSVPLNTSTMGRQLRYYLQDAGARHAVVEDRLWPVLRDALAEVHGAAGMCVWLRAEADAGPVPAADLPDGRCLPFSAHRDRAVPADHELPVRPRFNDPAFLMYTSGTTGPSKAVVAPHAHAVTTALIVAEQFAITATDRMFTAMPLFHANALWYTTLSAITQGACVILQRRFSLSRFWEQIVRTRATEFHAVGSMVHLLEQRAPDEFERNNEVRLAMLVPLPKDPRAYEARIGAGLSSLYALTEWMPGAMVRPGQGYGPDQRPGGEFCGPVLTEHTELRVVDDDDLPVPVGVTGEIVLRSRAPWTGFTEYAGKPEATAAALRNMWFHTGDLGFVGTDGNVYFVGRKKDAIRRRGENISAYEVEEIVSAHPAVLEAAAIAVPSELTEDEVCVFAAVREPDDAGLPARLHGHCAVEMPGYMVPRYLVLVDRLPHTASGKVEKYRLVERVRAGQVRLWDAAEA